MNLSKQSNQISIETTEELYELEKSEQNKIIVERDNAKILAQHFGTEYIESKDPSFESNHIYHKYLSDRCDYS
jgi:diaminopimelate epimerase